MIFDQIVNHQDNVMKHIQRYSDKLLYEREPAYLYTIIMTQRILVGV